MPTCIRCHTEFPQGRGRPPRLCVECQQGWCWCPGCKSIKTLVEFHAQTALCRVCLSGRDRKRRADHRKTHPPKKPGKKPFTPGEPLQCLGCGDIKPWDDFPWKNKAKGYKARVCKPCFAARIKASQDRDYEAYLERKRADHHRHKDRRNAKRNERLRAVPRRTRKDDALRRSHGIAIEDYERLLAEQGGVCAICKCHEMNNAVNGKQRDLAVDHSHTYGFVRGALCANCNKGVGYFADSPERLRAAADYLEKTPPAWLRQNNPEWLRAAAAHLREHSRLLHHEPICNDAGDEDDELREKTR